MNGFLFDDFGLIYWFIRDLAEFALWWWKDNDVWFGNLITILVGFYVITTIYFANMYITYEIQIPVHIITLVIASNLNRPPLG